jgi:hypothetical protein
MFLIAVSSGKPSDPFDNEQSTHILPENHLRYSEPIIWTKLLMILLKGHLLY